MVPGTLPYVETLNRSVPHAIVPTSVAVEPAGLYELWLGRNPVARYYSGG